MSIYKLNHCSDPELVILTFHFAGGGANVAFRHWAELMPEKVALYCAELPGRGYTFGQPLLKDWRSALDVFANDVDCLFGTPVLFFGHSLGSLLAYEFCHYCQRAGVAIDFCGIVVSARRPPHLPWMLEPYHHLPDQEFIERLSVLGGLPDLIKNNAELMDLFLPILRADMTMVEEYRYEPRPKLSLPMLVLGGNNDESVDVQSLNDWQDLNAQEVAVEVFEGGHFFILDQYRLVVDSLLSYFTKMRIPSAVGRA